MIFFYLVTIELFLEYLTLGLLETVVAVDAVELNTLLEENCELFHLKIWRRSKFTIKWKWFTNLFLISTITFLLQTKNMNSNGPCEMFIKSVGYDIQAGMWLRNKYEIISMVQDAPITINKRRNRKNLWEDNKLLKSFC